MEAKNLVLKGGPEENYSSDEENSRNPKTEQYLLNVENATIEKTENRCNVTRIEIKGKKGGLDKAEKVRFEEVIKRMDILEELLKKVLNNEKRLIIENETLKREFKALQYYFTNDWSKTRLGDFGNKYNEV